MFDGGMTVSFHKLNYPPVHLVDVQNNRTKYRSVSNLPVTVRVSSILVQNEENKNSSQSRKVSGSGGAEIEPRMPNSMLSQANTVGIIGGVSVFTTLIFLEKLVWWSTRDGEEGLPFVVCSDPALNTLIPSHSPFQLLDSRNDESEINVSLAIENLRHKRKVLEQSGAHCIVLPCHLSHAWYDEVAEGCLLPFFHIGECVARELKEANLKPLEAGSNVRIGVLATNAILTAGFYQDKLQTQDFEVVLPDKATIDRILIPSVEARSRKDMVGARNLLRIAIQILLVRAVNTVILASDEIQGLLPRDDPLLRKCIDPMDALARTTIRWATCTRKVQKNTVNVT